MALWGTLLLFSLVFSKAWGFDPSRDALFNENSTDPDIAALVRWAKQKCPEYQGEPTLRSLDNIYAGIFEHGAVSIRGLGVTRAIPKDETIVCVPKECWFGPPNMPSRLQEKAEHWQGTPAGDKCSTVEYRLAIWMGMEMNKGNASDFWPMLKLHPTREDYMQFHPAYVEEAELREHNKCKERAPGSDCPKPWDPAESSNYWESWLRSLWQCHEAYVAGFNNIFPTAQRDAWNQEPISWESMKLGYLRVLSREFYEIGTPAFVELPNTDDSQTAYNTQASEDAPYCLKALEDLKPGDEVLVDYDQVNKDPGIFFNQYGFSLTVHSATMARHGDEQDEDSPANTVMPEAMRRGTEFEMELCEGLRPQDSVHAATSGPGKNFAAFARRWCGAHIDEHPSGDASEL